MPNDRKGQLQGSPQTVGWKERVDIPEWGIRGVRAKLDTGARTSAIHVDGIEALDGDHVRFDVVVREDPRRVVSVEAEVVRWSSVRPSSGRAQQRPVVRAHLYIGGIKREAEVGLVSRKGMLCRMLVGRRAMTGLLVDPGERYLLTRPSDGEKHGQAPVAPVGD